MTAIKIETTDLENFDALFVGQPTDIEKNLKKLLPEANLLENKSIYLQILSQIALAQAMQKKFKRAHKTLDEAEKMLTAKYPIAQARILLERGRVYHQAHKPKSALPHFKKSYQFSTKHKLHGHASNAAHMIAFVVTDINEKIKWNKKSIAINKKSKDQKVRDWDMVDYNNLGSNYIQTKQYKKAIAAYEHAFKLAKQKGFDVIKLGAQWGIARSLRSLHNIDEAMEIQLELLEQYTALYKKRILPIELLRVARGPVYEELAEIYVEKAKEFSAFAYADLSKDPWISKLGVKRLQKMKRMRNIKI